MALHIDSGRIPPRWAEKMKSNPVRSNAGEAGTECVRIALVNNMPDAALEDTEMQFMELLEAAAGDLPVRLKLCSLPKVPRGERGQQHLVSFYSGIEELWNSRNVETWQKSFFDTDSIIVWAWTTWRKHRRDYPKLFREPAYQHVRKYRFTSPQQTDDWLKLIEPASRNAQHH